MTQVSIFLPAVSCQQIDAQMLVHWVSGQDTQELPFAQALERCGDVWRLVLPVEAVASCAVMLPTQKARWLRQALPFAVEEVLAEDVDQMHLALGPVLADGRHRVLALRRTWLQQWLALCGVQLPQQIVVDADLLPLEGTQLLYLDQRWLLGGDLPERLALQTSSLQALLPSLAEPLTVRGQPAVELAGQQIEVLEDPYLWLNQQAATVDLAQAEFARQGSSAGWQRWQSLASVVLACLVLQWLFVFAQGMYLQKQADYYQQASETLYRELFPADTRVVNVRAQFDQHLAGAGRVAGSQLLQLLDQASAPLQSDGLAVQVQQLSFTESEGDLSLQVRAGDFAALERLRERLEKEGLVVEMGSATRDAEGVSASVLIKG